jgi:hypothetical protein
VVGTDAARDATHDSARAVAHNSARAVAHNSARAVAHNSARAVAREAPTFARARGAWHAVVMRFHALVVVIVVAAALPSRDARALECLALGGANTMIRFDCARPDAATVTPIRGVTGTLVGIDRRPANGLLYGVSDANDVYVVDATAGSATAVSTLTVAFDGGARSGVDFNPQADRLRLIAAGGQNLRVNVDLGATAVDGPLRYAATDANAGKRPAITAAAYTSSVADAPSTKLFDIDSELDVLALQEPPNDGILTTIGPLGVDFGPRAGFDIATEAGVDRAFAVAGSTLYGIDLATGAARALGTLRLPLGTEVIGLAVVPDGKPGSP